MLNSRSKGEIGQLRVMLRAAEKGYSTSRPSTDCAYDLIVDNGNLIRCQIKYCNRKSTSGDCLELKLDNYKSLRKFYDHKDVDAILVYVPRVNSVLIYAKEKFHRKKTIYINLNNKKSLFYWEKYKW